MLKSYLKVAARNIIKHKYFSIINVLGMALGMSFSLLLITFYSYVSAFDDFHTKQEKIYRIISTKKEKGGDVVEFASAPAALAVHLQDQASGIQEIVRVHSTFKGNIVSRELNLTVDGYFADDNFFKVFDFELLYGDPATALSKPNSIVLAESVAEKIKPPGSLLGTAIEIEGTGMFEVTGIVKNEKQTHFQFDAFVSLSTLPEEIRGDENNPEQWTSFWNQYIYLLLDNSSDSEDLEKSINHIAETLYSGLDGENVSFSLQSLGDITPGPDLENPIGPDTDTTLFFVFATICLLILLPACFNYGNISIARALKRSKEVGIRKTMGGVRTQIFVQFIFETIILTITSLAGGILLFLIIAPEFKSMMMAEAWLDLSLTWPIIGYFLLFAVTVGILTGLFPALYFARLNPIQSLKGQSNSKAFHIARIRKGMVTFQFFLTFCFNLNTFLHKRKGWDRDEEIHKTTKD